VALALDGVEEAVESTEEAEEGGRGEPEAEAEAETERGLGT
jgi:hypothetical protein